MASQVGVRMSEERAASPMGDPGTETDTRPALVWRVLTSCTFEHSPKLRAFLEYVCRCALNNEPAAATEQQIGIHVFGRPPGYNANEDNIVRSQARLLRLKLEHHFANEGRHEPVMITIPKGRYLPAFEPRVELHEADAPLEDEETVVQSQRADIDKKRPSVAEVDAGRAGRTKRRVLFLAPVLVMVLLGIIFARLWLRPGQAASNTARQNQASEPSSPAPAAIASGVDDIRIAAGNSGGPQIDAAGHRWESDNYYQGGESKPGPEELFPPVSDPGLFRTIREGVLLGPHAPSGFRYDIPVPQGVYELRLYFADPIRRAMAGHDGQHMRHFQVNLNGNPILTYFDAVADAGAGAVDIRAFKDISAAPDGKIHLEFVPAPDLPFLSALELTPGTPGRLQPIRLTAHSADLVEDGVEWSGDRYFVYGSTITYASPENVSRLSPLYTAERYGNFSYAIPVPPGSYTLRLHFMETFFGPSAPSGLCWGAGCRIFDVTCNGESLLKDFDIYQVAGGDYRPLIRTFHGLHPNGQGKLLISFSPRADYGEVRAIEVIDEGKIDEVRH